MTEDWFIGDVSNAFLQGSPLTTRHVHASAQPGSTGSEAGAVAQIA